MTAMNEINYQVEPEEEKRPKFLTIVGILSFVSIGFQFIVFIFNLFKGKVSEEAIIEQKVQAAQLYQAIGIEGDELSDIVSMTGRVLEETNNSFWTIQLLTIVTLFIGLSGVLMMFRKRRVGFHLYIIYSLLAVGGVYLYLSPDLITLPSLVFSLMVSGLFIFFYARNLKWMTK